MVLAGGASSRFGRDKALVEVDRVPMAAGIRTAMVQAGAGTVLAVGGDSGALRALGFEWVEDRWPGEGPLGGLITALGVASTPLTVVAACDLPRVDAQVIALLARTASPDAATVPVVDGHRQPLLAAYPTAQRRRLVRVFDAGARSMHAGLAAIEVRELVVGAEHRTAFVDVDRPDDLPR